MDQIHYSILLYNNLNNLLQRGAENQSLPFGISEDVKLTLNSN